jgi:SAM-dependent methyltransferase
MKNEIIVECMICGELAELKQVKYPGYQEPEIFTIYHCKSCNTAFAYPMVETTALYENIYKNGEKVPGYDRYWRYVRKIKDLANPLDYLKATEDVYWSIDRALSNFVKNKKSTKILEIGCGLGYLTYSLLKTGYDIIGLDISKTAVKRANENFGNHYICADLFEYSQLHPESFNVIILTEVIEHVNNPFFFIKSIIRLLKPGGRAIITTPNKSFYYKEIVWATELPPVHYWWFSEESFDHIAIRMNLTVDFLSFNDFYRNNYLAVDMRKLLKNKLPKPFFNKSGELIVQAEGINKSLLSYIRIILTKVPFVKKFFRGLKKIFNPGIVVCDNRGIILCAIMSKK